MAYMETLLKSYVQLIPRIEVLSANIQKRNNFIVNYPLIL